MSVIGTTALGFARLPLQLPVSGITPVKLQDEIQGLDGTTTIRRRAIKRTWQLTTSILDRWTVAQLARLYEAVGPLSFYDITRSAVIPTERKYMRNWLTFGGGATLVPSADLRLTLVSGGASIAWAAPGNTTWMAPLPPVVSPIIAGITARATSLTTLRMVMRQYTAAGVASSTNTADFSTNTTEQRYTLTVGPNPAASFVQMELQNLSGGSVMVTDPSLGYADKPGWCTVHLKELVFSKQGPNFQTASLTLQEV